MIRLAICNDSHKLCLDMVSCGLICEAVEDVLLPCMIPSDGDYRQLFSAWHS